MGRWSSDIYKLYSRSNMSDLIRWQLALGRQSVNATETTEELLPRNNIPIHQPSAEAAPRQSDPDDDSAVDYDPDDVDCDP